MNIIIDLLGFAFILLRPDNIRVLFIFMHQKHVPVGHADDEQNREDDHGYGSGSKAVYFTFSSRAARSADQTTG